MRQVKVIAIYCVYSKILKILSLQHVINIKIIEVWGFFGTRSLKSGVYFTLTPHVNLD